jgi:hypothetical protein
MSRLASPRLVSHQRYSRAGQVGSIEVLGGDETLGEESDDLPREEIGGSVHGDVLLAGEDNLLGVR